MATFLTRRCSAMISKRAVSQLGTKTLFPTCIRAASTSTAGNGSDSRFFGIVAAVAGTTAVGLTLLNPTVEAKCHGSHESDSALIEKVIKLEEDVANRLTRIEAALMKLSNNGHVAMPTTGQGDSVFAWDEQLTNVFPADARGECETAMHGGFTEDPETGIVYTGIPGYGFCSISSDLTTWTKLGSDDILKENMHGLVFFQHEGEKLIATTLNNKQQVVIMDIQGNVKQVITKPNGDEFNFKPANDYYSQFRGKEGEKIFSCTDVTFCDGQLFVVTGYCAGDFVLTLKKTKNKWAWAETAWGGKGTAPGQFQTAHGVTAFEDHIYVSNREAHQVNKFTKAGKLVEILPGIPAGSRICNASRAVHDDRWYMNALAPVSAGQTTAPIYAYTDHVVSTIVPGDLGIPVLKHIHHCWPHYTRDASGKRQLYLLVHGWNKGKFAVLRQIR